MLKKAYTPAALVTACRNTALKTKKAILLRTSSTSEMSLH